MRQSHRTLIERLAYQRVYRCPSCSLRLARPRLWLTALTRPRLPFLLTLHTRCVKCGNPRVRRLNRRDRVDSTSMHPISAALHYLGAPLIRCDRCRIQYYDWRPIRREGNQT